MFDVNSTETMKALTKWWGEFRQSAPLKDEDMQDFCCVVVGNKTDLMDPAKRMNGTMVSQAADGPVTMAEALEFLNELVPPDSRIPSPMYDGSTAAAADAMDLDVGGAGGEEEGQHERAGERRGRRAFVGVRRLLENVQIPAQEEVLSGWISEMIDAGLEG